MANLNKVFLIGNLTRDPELRYATSGTAVANFSLAINRFYTAANGEKRQDTCFVRVVSWGKQAEVCSRYLNKGRPVFVEGRLSSRSWESPSGEKRTTIEVVAERVQFIDRPEAKETGGAGKEAEPIASEDKGTLTEDEGSMPPKEAGKEPAEGGDNVPF